MNALFRLTVDRGNNVPLAAWQIYYCISTSLLIKDGAEGNVFALTTEVVAASANAQVSVLSPGGAVGVAHKPVLHSCGFVDSVADDKCGVRKLGPLQALGFLGGTAGHWFHNVSPNTYESHKHVLPKHIGHSVLFSWRCGTDLLPCLAETHCKLVGDPTRQGPRADLNHGDSRSDYLNL